MHIGRLRGSSVCDCHSCNVIKCLLALSIEIVSTHMVWCLCCNISATFSASWLSAANGCCCGSVSWWDPNLHVNRGPAAHASFLVLSFTLTNSRLILHTICAAENCSVRICLWYYCPCISKLITHKNKQKLLSVSVLHWFVAWTDIGITNYKCSTCESVIQFRTRSLREQANLCCRFTFGLFCVVQGNRHKSKASLHC